MNNGSTCFYQIEHLQKYQPSNIFLLDENEYLADIIVTIRKKYTGEK